MLPKVWVTTPPQTVTSQNPLMFIQPWIFKFVNLQLVVSTTPCDGMAVTMTVVSNKIDAMIGPVTNIAPREKIFGRKVDHLKLSQFPISLLERWHLTPRHAFGLSYQASGSEDKVNWRPKHHVRNNDRLSSQQAFFFVKIWLSQPRPLHARSQVQWPKQLIARKILLPSFAIK